ncbi:cytochrome C [Halioglobus maricola]|uniref:Cytochrome c-type protein n=1 Tax=Halioglobus maricola TaxID=2601894 RepID=A0A5P9NLW8_9GAMM|nr:cytochrome C [Halioglobus maricola]
MVKFLKIALVLAGLGLGVAASWAVMDTMIHATGDDAFCGSCHSLEPMSAAYREDLHGGNNEAGWRATCSQCHIPQGNALKYLWVKGMHGIVDPTMELLKDPYDIDWHGNRERRTEFVYDSGCLSCHLYLQEATEGNRRAFRSHRRYFNDPDDYSCVECHENVGHNRLGYHLEEMGWPKPEAEGEAE